MLQHTISQGTLESTDEDRTYFVTIPTAHRGVRNNAKNHGMLDSYWTHADENVKRSHLPGNGGHLVCLRLALHCTSTPSHQQKKISWSAQQLLNE